MSEGDDVGRPSWVSADVDLERPSVARVYDYYLGGSHNFEVDREFAEKVIEAMPQVPRLARDNRAFLRRAVRALCHEGVGQFVDLGSGIPTEGNVHEVAQEVNPEAKVVYVDWDPVAVVHGQAILTGNTRAITVGGDLREPEAVFADPGFTGLIDLSEPVAVLLISVLHFVPDAERPAELISRIARLVAPGSYIVISHASPEREPEAVDRVTELYAQTPSPVTVRSGAEITALFGELEIIEPGVVRLPLWRPDSLESLSDDVSTFPGHAAVARI